MGRRLYRSEEDKILAGGCSGLAKAAQVDPLIIRMAFVALAISDFYNTPLESVSSRSEDVFMAIGPDYSGRVGAFPPASVKKECLLCLRSVSTVPATM